MLIVGSISLSGCDFTNPTPTDVTIKRIKTVGEFKKTHYALDDRWDLKGVDCVGVGDDKNEYVLSASEYTVKFTPALPRDYKDSLTVEFTYKKNTKLVGSKTFRDLSVDVPEWDFESEVESYYEDANLNLTGSSLVNELQRHSFEKHTYFVYYSQVKDYFEGNIEGHYPVDLIPNESKIELFYTGKKDSFTAGNREHVWASNDSNYLWESPIDSDYRGGGSDLYHVRPTTESINSAHGDGEYVDFSDKSVKTKSLGDGGPYKVQFSGLNSNNEFCDYLEVADEMKGDLARILAYVYMHYNYSSAVPSAYRYMTNSLMFSYVMGYTESQCKKKIIEWNELDPVSEVEKYRNHTVMGIQGNRNPFVDHPELIKKAFNQ